MAKKKTGYYDYLRQELGGLIEQLQLPDLYKQSLKRRWLDQAIWADKKAGECRKWHYRFRLVTIIGSVILPALVGINFQLGRDNPFFRTWFPYVPFALSQVIAVSAAIEEFCRFGDNWRKYREMAENLKAEGWQYLQLSGPYRASSTELDDLDDEIKEHIEEVLRTAPARKSASARQTGQAEDELTDHMQNYTMFASRVEGIIKQDVQNYVADLIKQQAKQEQQIEKYLQSAQTVTKDKSLFAQTNSFSAPEQSAPPGTGYPPRHGNAAPGNTYPPNAYSPVNGNGYSNGYGHAAYGPPPAHGNPPVSNGYTTAMMPPAAPSAMPPAAPPPPPLPAPPPSFSPPNLQPTLGADLNSAILTAAQKLQGMSTAEGPDGGKNACAWTLNKVLKEAGIPPLGANPNYVPSVLEALQQGRGKLVSKTEARAGDIVIAFNEAHVGIVLDNNCNSVLSNSSSRASFVWKTDADFDGFYIGPSTIYRLLR